MKSNELTWRDAITKVFENEKQALQPTEIAKLISEKGYKTSLGATPQNTVSATITNDIRNLGEESNFVRISDGLYILRKLLDSDNSKYQFQKQIKEKVKTISAEKTKIINAFGIYWNRNLVHWKSMPDLFGVQQVGATEVNFKEQIGIYLLHDSREIIYVGQAIDQSIIKRLKAHTTDRLSGRWDRFSWFGFYPVTENGNLQTDISLEGFTMKDFGDVLEAILIESIEPRQNRKQGNQFADEFLQQEDPEIKKQQTKVLFDKMKSKMLE